MINNTLKKTFSTLRSQIFKIAESFGVHITPVHFYSPIPHVNAIDPSFYNKINDCIGLDFQEIPLSVFQNADILFIDSSHVSKIGSDVNYEMLEIVPSMKVGSIIHCHDIMIPGEYPKSWVENNHIFWNESYMVHTFMLFNKAFKIIWASKYMQIKHPELLSQKFHFFSPDDSNQQMSSFWIERIA